MNWKHYIAIATPYLSAAVLAIIGVAAHSQDSRVAGVAVFIAAIWNHNSVKMNPPAPKSIEVKP